MGTAKDVSGWEAFDPSRTIVFRSPHLILAGCGALKNLGPEAKGMGTQKAFVVTDKGVMNSGIGKKVQEQLETSGIRWEIYDQVVSDPDVACAEACVAEATKGGYDLIVGVGGGSSMDIAATTAVMLTNPGKVYDYIGVNRVQKPGIPTILIPTTAGTGAEVTPYAALGIPQEKIKNSIISPYIMPRVSIVDPLLTLSMPPSVTSSSGIDALSHAVESYTHSRASILTDLFAKEAIILIGRSLRTAVANGQHLEARYQMSIGSLYAGIALANLGGTGVHALAHALGGHSHVPHGIACGLLLPPVMEFSAMGNIPKFANISHFLGERVDHLSLFDQAQHAGKAVKALYRELKIPQSLTELKVPREEISSMARTAISLSRMIEANPRILTVQDAEEIYRRCFE